MKESALYLKWIAILCAVMGVFGIGVLLVGYKDLSFNLVATIVFLFASSAVLAFVAKRKQKS